MSIPTSLCFSKNGWELISGGRDKVLNIWDLHKNELKKTIPTYEVIIFLFCYVLFDFYIF